MQKRIAEKEIRDQLEALSRAQRLLETGDQAGAEAIMNVRMDELLERYEEMKFVSKDNQADMILPLEKESI